MYLFSVNAVVLVASPVVALFAGEAAASLFTFTSSMTQATRAANYLYALEDTKDGSTSHPDDIDQEPPEIEVKDVRFAYPRRPAHTAPNSVSLTVELGQFGAFVGASGCGKTTMLALTERFYQPTAGVIYFAGLDTRKIHLRQNRRPNSACSTGACTISRQSSREHFACVGGVRGKCQRQSRHGCVPTSQH